MYNFKKKNCNSEKNHIVWYEITLWDIMSHLQEKSKIQKKKFNFILGDIMMQLWEIMLKLSDIKSQFWDTV